MNTNCMILNLPQKRPAVCTWPFSLTPLTQLHTKQSLHFIVVWCCCQLPSWYVVVIPVPDEMEMEMEMYIHTYIQLCRSWSLYIYPTVSLLVTVHATVSLLSTVYPTVSLMVTVHICNSCPCWHLVVSQRHICLHCRLAIASTVGRCYSKETPSVVSGIRLI